MHGIRISVCLRSRGVCLRKNENMRHPPTTCGRGLCGESGRGLHGESGSSMVKLAVGNICARCPTPYNCVYGFDSLTSPTR